MYLTTKHAADLDILKARLRGMEPGDTVTYAELSALIGRDILQHRYLILKACEGLLRAERRAFESVYRTGIRRLTADQAVEGVPHVLRRVRRIVRRGAAKVAAIDYHALSSDALRQQHNGFISVCAALLQCADGHALKRVSGRCSNSLAAPLPPASTLQMLAS